MVFSGSMPRNGIVRSYGVEHNNLASACFNFCVSGLCLKIIFLERSSSTPLTKVAHSYPHSSALFSIYHYLNLLFNLLSILSHWDVSFLKPRTCLSCLPLFPLATSVSGAQSRYSRQRCEVNSAAIPVKEEMTQWTPGSSIPQETLATLLSSDTSRFPSSQGNNAWWSCC